MKVQNVLLLCNDDTRVEIRKGDYATMRDEECLSIFGHWYHDHIIKYHNEDVVSFYYTSTNNEMVIKLD